MSPTTPSPQSIIIVGGGIVGSYLAYECALAGWDVDVFDPQPEPAASYANAGILALSYAQPMSNPRALFTGAKAVLAGGEGIELATPLTPRTLGWLSKFAWASRPGHAKRHIRTIYNMARTSVDLYAELEQRESTDLHLRRTGWLYVATSPQALRAQAREAATVAPAGVRSQLLDATETRAHEPALASDIVGGVFYPDDVSFHPGHVTTTVRNAAQSRGARFHQATVTSGRAASGAGVASVETDLGEHFRARHVVIAAGAQSDEVARLFGGRVAVEPGVGWSVEIPTDGPVASRALMSIDDHVVINPADTRVRLSGGMRFGGEPRTAPTPAGVDALVRAATRLVPAVGELDREGAVARIGARPMTADGLPVFKEIGRGVTVLTGHGTLGMTLAPFTAQRVFDLLSKATRLD
ncbi:FAD dependent oxidoreductase [Brevibacterium mcbrellneri ATCC 49030]|uniref:FAD dependent oxidoreductase n=1 Tax=Brevibacterium mcbrellneri ATCC 49030 TaxID=585530 RepID=D4YJA2_9MICO|nr:FAD-dependent oxidoreductase [Brevibacterium mcbrellneri]EFG48713.1 FAD dependent oxidoreductase [Brevibacterium mcbrellneri ATCC 49030]